MFVSPCFLVSSSHFHFLKVHKERCFSSTAVASRWPAQTKDESTRRRTTRLGGHPLFRLAASENKKEAGIHHVVLCVLCFETGKPTVWAQSSVLLTFFDDSAPLLLPEKMALGVSGLGVRQILPRILDGEQLFPPLVIQALQRLPRHPVHNTTNQN